MTRYLRPDLLEQADVQHFDNWAATFGKITSDYEETAYGTLKMRTRFAKFANLPELMELYKEFADIKSADKLNLPRPLLICKGGGENGEDIIGKNTIVRVEASPEQRNYVKWLAERAFEISNGKVDPQEDNMLKITHEARLIGLGNEAVYSLYKKYDEAYPKFRVIIKTLKNTRKFP